MVFYAATSLDQIRQRVSIVDVVSPYVQLKPSGHYLKGLSPFSNEKTPSFFVDPQKNIFKCFSTGYAGDVFRFIELKEQLTFPEAVAWLGERFNIPLELGNGQTENHSTQSIKKVLHAIYAQAEQYFQACFWAQDPLSEKVRTYWTEARHFSLETAKAFGVGLAPLGLNTLYLHLRKKEFSHEALLQSGLFYKPKLAQAHLISRFQGRLMLPIGDIQGRTIAFSGRQFPFVQLPQDPTQEAKYVNSPETPIFSKGKELFNLARARQALTPNASIYLVEGPLDVIRCWECGLKTVVAPQGTGLTEMQLKILKRYDVPLIGMFDGDSAGIKAGIRFMTLGIPMEMSLKYHLLAPEEDPDSAFLKNPERSGEIDAHLLSPIDFFIAALKTQNDDPERLAYRVLQQLFPIIQQCESSVLRFDLLQKLAKTLNIPYGVLENDLSRYTRPKLTTNRDMSAQTTKSQQPSISESLEGQVLLFLFHAPEWTAPVLGSLSLDWIDTQLICGQLLLRILNEFQENGIEPLNDRSRWSLSEEETRVWGEILATPLPVEDQKTVLNQILQQMNRKFLKKSIYTIDKRLLKSSNIKPEVIKQLQMDRFLYKKALANISTIVYF